MKVLVTGGLGFIGSWLANRLADIGYFVRVADIKDRNECYLPLNKNIEIYDHCDLRDFRNTLEAMKDMHQVFNLSAYMGGIQFITTHFADIMYNSTMINLNIAEACRLLGIKKIFFSSSACVYPEEKQLTPDNHGLKESDAYPANPDTFYGWEKLYAEKLYESFRKDAGLQIRIARFHNIYGPCGTYKGGREKAPAALCRKVVMAKDGDSIEIWGNGKQTRTFLYISDCIDAIIKLMESDCEEPLNVGSDRLISVDDLAKMIITISGKKLDVYHNLNAPVGVEGRSSENTKVKKMIGWEPKITYEDGLKRTYEWVSGVVAVDNCKINNK